MSLPAIRILSPLAVLLLASCPGPEDDTGPSRQTEDFPRCAEHDPLRRPFFGDTHVHTTLSLDATLQGNRLTPADAYRFARGAEVGIQPWDDEGNPLRTLQIDRPLDFVVVSDHAEFLGTIAQCTTPGSPGYDDNSCVTFRDNPDLALITINAYLGADPDEVEYPGLCGEGGSDCLTAGMDVWSEIRDDAEAAYDRTDACTFTSFVGYEWSGSPRTLNLHRNVIFRNEVVPDLPVSYFEEPYPEDLWAALESECLDAAPCDVLTIPHNTNLSRGIMYETFDQASARGLDADEAALRATWEPLIEIFQHKGASECLPGAPGSDEECGFEAVPYDSLAGANLDFAGNPLPQDYVRTLLGEGLRFEEAIGVNPYAWGFVGSTDTHLGTPGAVSENAFPGHGGAGRGNRDSLPVGLPDIVTLNPGGLAVLWAEENTREALFRAMRRREAYGTSGPRIVLRFFGGWSYDEGLCDATDFEQQGYDGGVPMGGVLPAGSGAPSFAISALADLGTDDHPGALLQRLQVVKGALSGATPEFTVYDVAGDADNGADVDLGTCEPTGPGETSLCTVWTDPDFDPDEAAFYYVRVLENPTCRWHTRQCLAAGITCPTTDSNWDECCDERVETTVQERAWSSPIWYVPAG